MSIIIIVQVYFCQRHTVLFISTGLHL